MSDEAAAPVDLAREAAFTLGGIEVSPPTRELLVAGRTEAVQPRVMQVLVALARRRGQVVSRDDLIRDCWNGLAVSEDAINRCIQAIRRIAEAHGGFSVQTVARVGYRLRETESAEPAPSSAIADAPRPRDERRRLTVLSSAVARGPAPVDPEVWRAMAERHRAAVSEAVSAFGGHVAAGGGEAVVAYFGYPEAQEDAAERAVRAGLATIAALTALPVRIGVHAGVVVTAQSGVEIEVFGEVPEIAARVRALADVDSVAVTGAVRAMIASLFVLEPHGAAPLDGAIDVYTVVSPAPEARPGRRDQTRFVGRADELQLLVGRWARVRTGEGRHVLVAGEPGIGKSRLVREFRARIQGDGPLWLACAGERLTSNTPLHAAGDLVGQALRVGADAAPGARIEAIERALAQTNLPLDEAVPLLCELMGLAPPAGYPPLALTAEQTRRRLLDCLAAWVLSAARTQPLVIVMEDLQWLDPSTLELLQTLGEQGAGAPLMLLCTARPEFQPPWPMRSHHARITLDRLSRNETRSLVASVTPKGGLAEGVLDAVIERTDGVPLFAEELSRLVLEGRAGARDIPATLHDSLAARLDRLGPAKAVAQAASVLGREFAYPLIAAVSGMPAAELDAGLARLADAELIYVRGSGPAASYQFKHALILDAAYEALLKSERRALHARAARVLTEQFPAVAAAQPETLARHWSDAGAWAEAVAAWARAASQAAARHAYAEAIESYRQALTMLAELPETAERDGREFELVIALSDLVGAFKGYPSDDYVALNARVAALAEKTGGLQPLVMQTLVRYVSAFTAGELVRARELADVLLDLAQREGGDASLRLGHTAQVTARNGVGDLVGAEAHFRLWSSIVDRAGYGQFHGETAGVFGAAFENAWLIGRPDLARERVERMAAYAVACDSPFERALGLLMRAWLCVLERDPPGAAAAAAEALAIAEAQGFTQANQIRVSLGWARAQLGDAAEGVALVERSLPGWVGGGLPRLMEARRVLAQVLALSGAEAEALAEIDAVCEAPAENPVVLCAHRLARAELRLALRSNADAEPDLRAALATAREQQAKALELQAATLLAGLLQARGETDAARELLAPVCGGFAKGPDAPDLTAARALLDQLG